MAVQLDQNGKDDLKTQFATREGTYRLMTLSEYSRPNRVGYQTNQNNPQVRVSLVSLPSSIVTGSSNNYQLTTSTITSATVPSVGQLQQQQQLQSSSTSSSLGAPSIINGQPLTSDTIDSSMIAASSGAGGDRICFNFGKELYVYAYRGCKKLTSDLSKPIDKKLYKGTNPSCHDFNETAALADGAPLLVGFTTGQIQLVQPGKREPGRLYNEERFIDKTKVTCLKWLPNSTNLFLASHSSGHLYLYNEELPCAPAAPNYQPFKSGDGYAILTCKSKTTRNPLYKWTFASDNCSINEFSFSPCGQMLAIVSQDGFLRVFNYDKMEFIGVARSYFGGFLCVCWSPDGKYIVVGGEDDLVTVWSVQERRVVARGQGHRSWVSVVAFDPYTSYSNWDGPDFSDDENPITDGYNNICGNNGVNYNNENHTNDVDCGSNSIVLNKRPTSSTSSAAYHSGQRESNATPEKLGTSYRLGSVSQDTQLCLWDITEDILRQSYEIRQRLSSYDPQVNGEQQQYNDVGKSNQSASGLNVVELKDVIQDGGNSNSSKNSSNNSSKSGSKFATANCTSGSGSESGRSSMVNIEPNTKYLNSSYSKNSGSTLNSKLNNYGKSQIFIGNNVTNIGAINTDSLSSKTTISTTTTTASSSTTNDVGHNKSLKSSGSHHHTHEPSITAFNSITQRLSNFSFGNDKKTSENSNNSSSHSHKKTFTFSKSSTSNHHHHHHHHMGGFLHSNTAGSGGGMLSSSFTSSSVTGNFDCGNVITGTIKNTNKTITAAANTCNQIVSSYDPMQLIGTSVCPRFDECPLLEPLVCKKIAHERLTALIFREDCFLTACQDGFIYTWARPGYTNIPQHMSASPSAPPGGTVV